MMIPIYPQLSSSWGIIKTGRFVRITYNMDPNITKFSHGMVLSGTRNLSIFLAVKATSFSKANIDGLVESVTSTNNIIIINYK